MTSFLPRATRWSRDFKTITYLVQLFSWTPFSNTFPRKRRWSIFSISHIKLLWVKKLTSFISINQYLRKTISLIGNQQSNLNSINLLPIIFLHILNIYSNVPSIDCPQIKLNCRLCLYLAVPPGVSSNWKCHTENVKSLI